MQDNLPANASKWAGGGVAMSVTPMPSLADGNWLEIRVDDDGPGLPPEQMCDPVIRGRRLDETKPGSGLGHSIVADLAQSYRGQFTLEKSKLGGLSAKLDLPSP